MRKFRYFAVICLSGMLISSAFGQIDKKATVKGSVFAKDTGTFLTGANVSIKGSSIGAATGMDGKFSFRFNTNKMFTVVVQFMGYKKLEKIIYPGDDVSKLRFDMDVDVFRTQAVVITGIASKRSKDIAEVAVARVSASDLTEVQAYQDLSQLVAAKIPGVRIETSSGNVGGGIRFNMRSGGGLNGDEQPVIYVDGVRINSDEYEGTGVGGQGISLLADINPEDIANIEILKGPAAAASYGTNGSNGVVLITTKRGSLAAGKADGVSINYKMVTGSNTQAYDYSADDFVNAHRMNATHHTGQISQHTLNASGGAEVFKYYLGLDRRYEEGLMVNNHFDRRTLRANFDVYPNDKLILRSSSSYSLTENRRPENDNNTYSWIGQTYKDPAFPSIDSLAITKINNTININRFISSLEARWTPFRRFETGIRMGIDNYDLIDIEHYPFGVDIGSTGVLGKKDIRNRKNTQYTFQTDAQYKYNPVSGLTVNSMVGAQIFDRRIKSSGVEKKGYLTGLITDVGSASEYTDGWEGLTHYREAGIFTEHSLSYLDQYYASFMIRKDYASTIGENAPSIIYPRASMALRMDKYSFFPSLFNMMKIRVAYGETGVLPGRRDAVRLLWYGDPSAYGVGAQISRIGNENLKPERVKELEIGFDTELFTNYAVEFTYYRQNAEESIVGAWEPPSTGRRSNAIPSNIGKVEGWGFESMVQARFSSGKNFEMDLSLTNNYQTNKVIDMDGSEIIGSRSNVIMEGIEKHAFYNYKIKGAIFKDDGTYGGPAFEDAKSLLGTPIPPYTGAFSLNTRILKNLNINILLDWATGLSIFNYTLKKASSYSVIPRQRELQCLLGMNKYYKDDDYAGPVSSEYYNSIDPLEVGSTEYNAAANEYATYEYYDANFIEPADYIKLREVSISYRLTGLLDRLTRNHSFFSDFVLGLSARNVWQSTKYSGPSVELNSSGSRSSSRGIDFYTLQLPRVYNFWIKFSL
ncbi:TonB-dependent receptor [bacterium]|nr:TonB-dependent receptor [bacterium]